MLVSDFGLNWKVSPLTSYTGWILCIQSQFFSYFSNLLHYCISFIVKHFVTSAFERCYINKLYSYMHTIYGLHKTQDNSSTLNQVRDMITTAKLLIHTVVKIEQQIMM